MKGTLAACLAFLAFFSVYGAKASDTLVAAAANFTEPAKALAVMFEKETGRRVTVTWGSTGMLYAQIRNGAPYHVLLAADRERPRLLEEEGKAVPGTRFTYAVGRLVLWSADPGLIGLDGPERLRRGAFRRLAVANPELAPYGVAAKETLEKLELWESVRTKIVMGQNIGQVHSMVATGNAELGFVALSQLVKPLGSSTGVRWPGAQWAVPAELHAPIRQDAVLLKAGEDNEAARAFLVYLQSEKARAVMAQFGYGSG